MASHWFVPAYRRGVVAGWGNWWLGEGVKVERECLLLLDSCFYTVDSFDTVVYTQIIQN